MKKVKKLTVVLIIVLLCLISFIGIYVKSNGLMKNIIKDYDFGMNIEGYREVRLSVKENDSESDEAEEQQITSEKVEQVKQLLKKRLKQLGSEDYLIKANYTTGEIVLELEETEQVDRIVADIYSTGDFKLVDSEDKNNVLMTNADIEKVNLLYSSTEEGTGVYLNLDFTDEGAKKIEDLSSNAYKTIEKEEADEEGENAETAGEELNGEDNNENSSENTEEVVQPKMTLMIDDTELLSSSFDTPITNGTLQLSLNQASTNIEKIQEAVSTGAAIASILNNGPLPLEYELDSNTYIYSDITDSFKIAFAVAISAIILVALVILVIKYKVPALFAGISYIGFVALYLLTLRYANIVITLEGVAGILIVLILNYLLMLKLLANKTILDAFKEIGIQSIPVIIVIIVFSFINWTSIASFGMIMFWGALLTIIYHLIVTNALLEK